MVQVFHDLLGMLIDFQPKHARRYANLAETIGSAVAEYVREEKQMSLPEAIRKMTSFPAQRLGIPDRGILRDGMKADITVFHPRNVKAPATRTEPKQFPIGIEYVVVNGTVVVDEGRHTGALPGRALKHGRAAT